MKVVSNEIAVQELDKWLQLRGTSARKVDECKRRNEDEKSWFDETVELIEYGVIVLKDEGKSLCQVLEIPVAETPTLQYKQRLTQDEFAEKAKGIAKNDTAGINAAYICALTGSPIGVIKRMDWEDLKVARHIASFFA